jgi:hypothetical protein
MDRLELLALMKKVSDGEEAMETLVKLVNAVNSKNPKNAVTLLKATPCNRAFPLPKSQNQKKISIKSQVLKILHNSPDKIFGYREVLTFFPQCRHNTIQSALSSLTISKYLIRHDLDQYQANIP